MYLEEEGKYPITWYIDAIQFNKRNASKASIGICGYSKKIAFISNNLINILVMKDLYADDKLGCEDAEHCLCKSCKFNKANPEKFNHMGVKSQKTLNNLLNRVEKLQEKSDKEYPLKSSEYRTQYNCEIPIFLYQKIK